MQRYPHAGLYRHLGFQEVELSRISTQSAHEDDKVVKPTHRPPLSSCYSFLLETESTSGP